MKLISVLATLSVISSASAGCLRAQRRLSGDAPDSLEAPVEAAPTEHTHDRKLYPSIPCSKGTFKTVEQVFGSMVNAQTCFNNAVSMMKAANWNDFAGPALRAAFHDAGTYNAQADSPFGKYPAQCGGANGSFKYEFAAGSANGFSTFPQQNGMGSVYNLMWGTGDLANKIRNSNAACSNFSNADLMQILGYVAVVKTGGAPPGGCGFIPGRTDAAGVDDTTKLPSEANDDSNMIKAFGFYEFSDALYAFDTMSLAEGVATLSGAHTIGKSRAHDKSATSMGFGALSGTPDTFDGGYYAEVDAKDGYSGMRGWFMSDRHGRCDTFAPNNKPSDFSKTVCASSDYNSDFEPFYHAYAQGFLTKDDSLFKNKFCQAYQAMGTIGYTFPSDYSTTAANFMIV